MDHESAQQGSAFCGLTIRDVIQQGPKTGVMAVNKRKGCDPFGSLSIAGQVGPAGVEDQLPLALVHGSQPFRRIISWHFSFLLCSQAASGSKHWTAKYHGAKS